MSIIRIALIIILSFLISEGVFASEKDSNTGSNTTETSSSGITSTGSTTTETVTKKDEDGQKEREKTMDDINNFLIESYKIKIDKILADLNVSIERVTNNDPVAQAKLLGKIRADIASKIQVINSHNVSVNRKKILSSVFLYIQQNLDAEIQKLAQQK